MEIKCPSCNGILEYDVVTDTLKCLSCGRGYMASEITYSYGDEPENKRGESFEFASNDSSQSMYDSYVCKCKSCGAELLYATKTEVTSVCAYCGNRSVDFDRIEKSVKPDYIIPFVVSKDKAIELIKQKAKKSIFTSKEYKDVIPDKIVGIYVPFMSYDMYIYQEMLIQYTVSSGRTSVTKEAFRVAETDLTRMTIDASRSLINSISAKIEPFDTSFYKPFSPSYLSGYFADRKDASDSEMEYLAKYRSFELLKKDVYKKLGGRSHRLLNSTGINDIKRADYVMLPVWFMPMKYRGETYTYMVNGQTGKVVGMFPIDDNRLIYISGGLFLILALIICPILCITFDPEAFGSVFGMCSATIAITFVIGFYKLKRLKESLSLTTSPGVKNFAKERQDRD